MRAKGLDIIVLGHLSRVGSAKLARSRLTGSAVSREVFYNQAYSLPEALESSDWFIPDKTKLTPESRERLPTRLSEERTFTA
jgi:hypothetical protein